MARFIMANRRAGLFTDKAKLNSRNALDVSYQRQFAASSDLVNDWSGKKETSRRTIVLDIEPQEVSTKLNQLPPEVLIEPEILHYPETALPLDLARMRQQSRLRSIKTGSGNVFTFTVKGAGKPLVGAEVVLYLRGSYGMSNTLKGVTDENGSVIFDLSSFWQAAAAVISPVGDFWRHIVRGPKNGDTVTLRKLPGTGYTAWWHRLHGINAHQGTRGQGVKVGVADTGLGPHPNLIHVHSQGAFIDGAFDADGGADVDSHGTHVAGTIGARPSGSGELAGLAPGADLFAVRVFPPDSGANQGDIANAIDHLSAINECDLINLSLGSPQGSAIEHDAIIDAMERGTLCVCAAANDGVEPVNYPAKFPETLAISAIGLNGWGPDGSIAALNYPDEPEKYGNDGYFLASFSNFGPSVSGAGGGVGIISTVPERYGHIAPYAVMDGTSMASPAACGAIAAMLARDPQYLSMPRDIMRAERARTLFRASALDLGLAAMYQGRGAPQAT